MKLIQSAIILCSLSFTLGCTAASSGGSSTSLIENPKGPDANEAQKQINEVQSKINSDSRYVLNSDEAVFLSEQGVVTDEAELKGWVK